MPSPSPAHPAVQATTSVGPRPLLHPSGPVEPVLKWPGGKRRERAALTASWPSDATRYLEPFVGGGAMWLATDPAVPAAVNDASEDLVATWWAVQDADPGVLGLLASYATWWDDLRGHPALVDRLASLHPVPATGDAALDAAVAAALDATPALAASAPTHLAGAFDELLRLGIPRKLRRMAAVQAERGRRMPVDDLLANVEGALRAAAYTAVRGDYNRARRAGDTGPRRTAAFVVLRELAYAAMFRFNAAGEFNVPYGGLTYNRKDLVGLVEALRRGPFVDRVATTELHLGDFEDFLAVVAPGPDDFVFVDPPYLSDFSTYDGNGFGPDDHRRLAGRLGELPCRFQLVVKATDEVRRWYARPGWAVREVDKTYAWTIKSRNDRSATHLVVENA